MKRIVLLVVALLLQPGQGFAQSAQERIEKGTAAYEEAFNAGDTKAVTNFYTDDAALLPPGDPRIAGKEAIAAYYQETVDAGLNDIDLESVEVIESGNLAVNVGTFTMGQPDGTRAVGKFVVVLQRGDDDRWHVHRAMWNTDSPVK